jgi:hypothetical protein
LSIELVDIISKALCGVKLDLSGKREWEETSVPSPAPKLKPNLNVFAGRHQAYYFLTRSGAISTLTVGKVAVVIRHEGDPAIVSGVSSIIRTYVGLAGP